MDNYTKENMALDFEEAKIIVCNAGLTKCELNHYNLTLVPKMSSLGRCRRQALGFYEIKLNQLYASASDHNNIINTLIHEILHSLPGGMNHTGPWKEYAAIIYNRTGIKIQRLATNEECKGYYKEKAIKTIEAHPDKVVYQPYCKDCGKTFHIYQKRTEMVKYIEGTENCTRYYCTKCHSHHLGINLVPYSSYMQKIVNA